MLKHQETRLIINLNELRQFEVGLAVGLLREPVEYIPPLEAALDELVKEVRIPDGSEAPAYRAGFEGAFGELQTTPRLLSSRWLSHMLCLEGIVTSCSLVRPKLLRSIHYAEQTNTFLAKDYWDGTVLSGNMLPISSLAYPTEDENKQKLSSEFGLSLYRDYQMVTLQEMPEKAPAGQLPRSLDIILDADLVDRVKPGDRVRITGVYKAMPGVNNGQVSGSFRTLLLANHIRILSNAISVPSRWRGSGEVLLEQIRQLSRRPDVFDVLARSVAPSISGMESVKRGVLMLLLGGIEHNLPNNGTHLRGDINILLVGDPGTAKSQMLRYVLSVAPLAIATTGRGSSGVGLTAAVTHDKETGERRLEAGAMVLADRGIVCIDEFDKMSDMDRVAIHEAMEQQTVTISKAGIHTTLNARCSVLAAANPVWGQYRPAASPQENIRLPDSLLSRFDLLFVVLDRVGDVAEDRKISEHVLRMHRYVPPGHPEGTPIPEDQPDDSEDENEDDMGDLNSSHIYAKKLSSEDEDVLTTDFFRLYLQYARDHVTPVLTRSASDIIVSAYCAIRAGQDEANMANTLPITPRTLETLIRLATAHAKARLSQRVEKQDALVAEEILRQCLFKEIESKKRRGGKKKKVVEENEEESEDEKGLVDSLKDTKLEDDQRMEEDAKVLLDSSLLVSRPPNLPTQSSLLFESQSELTKISLERLLSRMPRDEQIHISSLGFKSEEPKLRQLLEQLADENKIMFAEDGNYIILI